MTKAVTIGFLLFLALSLEAAPKADRVDFNFHIKPLLSDRCYACHGPDEKARKAKLRLDQQDGAFKGLEGGRFIIKPGDLAGSEVYRRISSNDPDEKMPPQDSHLSLSSIEIDLIKRWIEQGAPWTRHWSLLPIAKADVPTPMSDSWAINDIDRFVLKQLQQEGLAPSRPATKERLLRRVTFDLTGLPPTIPEIDAFLSDTSSIAYERVVDRLLASSAYGERMAVEWLDVARYADTHGYQADRYNHLWPWRDWVISAFNRNISFRDFILWQIAGDLLPGATREQKLATAFNRLHRQTNEGGSVEEEFRVEYVADRVHTAAGAFLGLTMECARCHDHKYDPVSQKDYYRVAAFFNSTDESGLYSHFTDAIPSPTLLLFKDDAQEKKHRQLKQDIAAKEKAFEELREFPPTSFDLWLRQKAELPRHGVSGLIGHYSFDFIDANKATNVLGTNFPAKLAESPQTVPGKIGRALQFSGENSVAIDKIADFKRTDPFSFTFWLNIPEELPEIVVLHHQQAGSDAGYHGYQLVLEHGKATFALIHFWPGNAIKVSTRNKLPLREWMQIGITYDGSSRAAGIKLYLNGQPAAIDIVRDHLFKDIANGQPLTLAARFRGRGFKDGLIDDLKIYNRCLSPLEVEEAFQPGSLQAEFNRVTSAYHTTGKRRLRARLLEYYLAIDPTTIQMADDLKKLRDEENALINSVPEIMVMGDLPQPRPTHVLKRGLYDSPGETVEPSAPTSILPFNDRLPRNRLGFAQWLVDSRNPLTARVIVNRYWQMFFGNGLVETSDNFGSQGTLPSNPELLDWLATSFIESGWDLKALHKQIVMSAIYRQASEASPELLARDPENRLLARGPKKRLTAEMLRDQALSACGLLVRKVGGPSVKPYQPEGVWEEKSAAWKYEADKGEGLHRRSLYTFWKRTVPHPSMIAFDAAERNNCTVRRQNTSTPLQPLVLLNDPQFVEAARNLAQRALTVPGDALENQLRFLFRSLTSRDLKDKELAVLRRLYEEQLKEFDQSSAAELLKVGQNTEQASPPQLAAMTSVALAVLNHDESISTR